MIEGAFLVFGLDLGFAGAGGAAAVTVLGHKPGDVWIVIHRIEGVFAVEAQGDAVIDVQEFDIDRLVSANAEVGKRFLPTGDFTGVGAMNEADLIWGDLGGERMIDIREPGKFESEGSVAAEAIVKGGQFQVGDEVGVGIIVGTDGLGAANHSGAGTAS